MSSEYSGKGDPRRSLALLWRAAKSPTRGPKPGISVADITRAAIEIADSEGLGALSMRRVAERLGVGAMSLYTYVPGKAELLDLMLDTVFGEVAVFEGQAHDWRAALEFRAREDWSLYVRHQWVLQISGARPVLGPHETMLFEATAAAAEHIGLSAGETVSVVNLIAGYVRGAAQGASEASLAGKSTGQSDEAWWAAREPLFDEYFDPQRFPTLVRLQQAGAFEPAPDSDKQYLHQQALNDFEFGLQRVLDGIEAFMARRA